jgi:hypothetical protein
MPLDLALTLVGLVVGIGSELILLPLSLACALTVFLAAIALIFHSGIGFEQVPTLRTLNLLAHGFPPAGEKP